MTQRFTSSRSQTHAIVIGGSMGGMLAARVLAQHFDRVTIMERDRLPTRVAARKGTPQARHLHVLLERGRQILERLFPGLSQTLVDDGASVLDTAADFSILNPAGWAVQFRSGIPMLTCSRDMLDWHVRRRLQGNPQIVFEQEVDVIRLIADSARTGVRGVAIRRRNAAPATLNDDGMAAGVMTASSHDGAVQMVHADFVVDASGRGSRAPQWLESLGYGRPDETVVDAQLGYATRVFRRPAGLATGSQGLFVQAAPPKYPRAGAAVPIEGDRWIVTVSGGNGDYPPNDDAGFLDFVRNLRSPAIHEALKGAEALSPIFAFRGLENRLRHFDRLPQWPNRFVVLGDAACAFNPVYAQGITMAALAAMELDKCLSGVKSRHPQPSIIGLAGQFQKELARVAKTPWLLATGEDRRYRNTKALEAGVLTRCTHRYMDYVFHLITRSSAVRKRSLEVFHLIRHPITLLHPGNLARVVAVVASEAARRSAHRFRGVASMLFGRPPGAAAIGRVTSTMEGSNSAPLS